MGRHHQPLVVRVASVAKGTQSQMHPSGHIECGISSLPKEIWWAPATSMNLTLSVDPRGVAILSRRSTNHSFECSIVTMLIGAPRAPARQAMRRWRPSRLTMRTADLTPRTRSLRRYPRSKVTVEKSAQRLKTGFPRLARKSHQSGGISTSSTAPAAKVQRRVTAPPRSEFGNRPKQSRGYFPSPERRKGLQWCLPCPSSYKGATLGNWRQVEPQCTAA